MRIHEMESSKSGKYFLAAEFKNKVAAYESATGKKLGEYDTRFESGGKRMCIADSDKYFAAAAYGRFGITLYDIETGSALWTTKEVKRIQRIYFSADDTELYAINNDCDLYTLSVTDGSIISREKDIEKIYPDSRLQVKVTYYERLKWDGGSATLSDKMLQVCSGNGRVYCTIFRGGLKCFGADGSKLWTAQNKPEEHYVKICFYPKFDYVVGLGYKFGSERTDPILFLDVYCAESGELVYSVGLKDTSSHTFIDNGERVVSGNGDVYTLGKDGFIFNGKRFDI